VAGVAEHWTPGLTPSPAAEKAIRQVMDGGSGLVIDVPTIGHAMERLTGAARRYDIELLHTVKASSLPAVLRTAHGHGLGFDVSNRGEWEAVTAAVPDPHLLSLTPSTLAPADLAWAGDLLGSGRLDRVHLDSLQQLRDFVGRTPPGPVGLRLNFAEDSWPPDVPARRLSRFGVSEQDDAAAVRAVQDSGHEIAWLHLHNASEKNTTASFVHAATLMMQRAGRLGGAVRQLNLGGGLPKTAVGEIEELFAALRRIVPADVAIMLEPGRWWGRESVTLVAQILDIKIGARCVFVVVDTGSEYRRWSVPATPAFGPHPGRPDLPYVICGVSAYEQDFFGQVTPSGTARPPEAGDWLVLGGLSTYSAELATNFNGVRTEIIVVEQ
jgi:diaminopimelate decarboxylase